MGDIGDNHNDIKAQKKREERQRERKQEEAEQLASGRRCFDWIVTSGKCPLRKGASLV